MKDKIKQLEEAFEKFSNKVGRLQGEYSTLRIQQETSGTIIEKLKHQEEVYTKAVQLLTLVQQITRDKVKQGFEDIVSHALNYIFESDKYSFELDFNTRGNLQTLDFKVRTPDKDEPLDLIDTSGGGVINIVSFALRVVLMELTQPKTEGFIIADETFANLSEDRIERASQFLKEINQKMNRQVIAISHQNKMLDSADKLIEVK